MAEYIERKAVFDKLAVIYDLARTNQRAVITNALREVSHIPAADVQPVNRWISVKDRLPDEDGAYLCYLESGIVCEANYDSTIASEGEFPFGEWVTYYNSDTLGAEDNYWEAYDAITHWMELPESPKDGDSNE